MPALIKMKEKTPEMTIDGLVNFSQYIDGFALAATTSERIPIPAGAKAVVIRCTAPSYAVLLGNSSVAAAFPTDITNGTGSELNPPGYLLDNLAAGTTHLAIIASAVSTASLAWYA